MTTNAYGATLTIHNPAEEEVFKGQFTAGKLELDYAFDQTEGPFTYTVSLAGVTAVEPKQTPQPNAPLEIPFDEGQLTEIRRAAGCLLMIPGGGFGSGFLLGDRQSIATAAHCVACKNVEELEIIFHPTEDREKKIVGAKLIYFDAKQDVALLHLSEPMEDDRPYFWKRDAAKEEDKVIILGNPGRNGKPDPMYSRSATVKGTRADEFFVDIEVKPGYSGGPVMLAEGMDVVGITSFKYVSSRDYKKDGQSFAKSADIASDAFQHWDALSSRLKEQKLEREAKRYKERYHYVIANEAAEALLLDSVSYTLALIDIANHYNLHMKLALRDLPNPVSVSKLRREEKKAHDEYIKEHGPRKAEQIKERLSPKLR
ncbi:MAG TPA: serine protease, partial [Planctomycetaceae bacterium]|nr:serine protease [Planctomycetaceae bacterium]